ncbi:uncharacterized protein PAC_02416 [Phialocephala subalpina]|uniref:Thioesterase-like superfamily-domain-containing protein n=1 Tax=Phialocephala subalpina TaxID=576137 RepID=A0A1L7WIE4_9HELO|nr:uncharacterized protein PAC_02416 [Phialocephala subalpina]
MADAHVSNALATPDWKPLNYTPTPMRDALKTEFVEGTDNQFSAFLPRNWCVPGVRGPVGFGGYCAALILASSQRYFATKYPTKNQPDPIHAHIQYLNELPGGPITIKIHDLKLGSKQSVIQVELLNTDSSSISVLSLITMGNLSGKGHSIETPLFEVPDINECQRWVDGLFFHLQPTSAQYRAWTPKGGPNPLWSPAVGRNKRDMWVKIDDEEEEMSLLHLGVLVDNVPSLPLNYEKGGLKGEFKWVFPTICLNIDIRRDPAGEEFLLQRVVMNECANGRFDMEVKIIDSKGRLVATSTHANLMLARGGGQRQKKEKSSSAKL